MLKYSTATSLVALALLGCFVGQGVEAQLSSDNLMPRASFVLTKPQTQSYPGTHPGHQTHPGTSGIHKPSGPRPQKPSDPRPQKPSDPRPQKPTDPRPQPPPNQRPPIHFPWNPNRPQKPLDPRPQKPSDPRPQKPSDPRPQKPSDPRPQKPTDPRPQKPTDPRPQKPTDPRPQKPTDPRPQKPYPITSNPSWSFATKKPSYQQVQPRTSPVDQKVPQTIYDPSPGGDHQTVVTKNPNYNICEVEDSRKVPCGRVEISSSECLEIDCCYDGYGCYFGKAVTLQCTKDGHFIVVVSKYSTQPNIDLNSLSLLGDGENCGPIDSNSEFVIYYFAVSQCGTIVREEDPGVIVYDNFLFSYFETQHGKYGEITRDTTYDLLFQCRYTATAILSLVVELIPGTLPLPVASTGPLRVHMQLANGICTTKGCNPVVAAYTSFYEPHDYPVHKVLREPVYVQVELMERTDPLVVLTLDHCWTTTSPHPHTYPQWDILINGCPNPDDPYTAELVPVGSDVPFPGHYRRFLFYMFAFLDDVSEPTYQQLYLHCSTSLCLAIPGSYCEPNCFRKINKREAAATATEKTVERNVVVTAGPVTMSAPSSTKE
eukprot:XP_011605473.1 PREDICTED: zona pellucida sperm-binding protein 4-like [Takifugu rubripes]